MKKSLPSFLITILILIAFTLSSCLKDDDSVIKNDLPLSATFQMKDSLKISDSDSSGPAADIYKRYNGKTYTVNSIDKVVFSVNQTGAGVTFNFEDTSVSSLNPSFTITIKNGSYTSLAPSYDLTDTSKVKIEQSQKFSGGLSASGIDVKVLTGILKITYNQASKTVSGNVENFKTLLGYYVTENITAVERSTNGILLLKGGSSRTVDLSFSNVPAK